MAQQAIGMIETKGLCALLEAADCRPQGRQRPVRRLGKNRQRLCHRLFPRRRSGGQGRHRRRSGRGGASRQRRQRASHSPSARGSGRAGQMARNRSVRRMKILVANLGSTSLKYRLFDFSGGQERLLTRGGFERVTDYAPGHRILPGRTCARAAGLAGKRFGGGRFQDHHGARHQRLCAPG